MVKCVGCGLLATRNPTIHLLEEVQEDYRRTGEAPMGKVEPHSVIPADRFSVPLCLARIYDLPYEVKGDIARWHKDKCLRVIHKERLCDCFTKWQQGFSPKEHREMMDREKFEKRQEDREEADRKWRAKQDLRLVLIAGIFTILGAVLAYLSGGR